MLRVARRPTRGTARRPRPDPVVSARATLQPEEEALLADSVGLALLVVLDTLSPAERLAFVLHDMFDLPFDEIAPMVGRTPAAARQLASRARRRVRGADRAEPAPDLARQREVVEAFFSAVRDGDFDALVTMLDPNVVVRIDAGATHPASMVVRGAEAVVKQSRVGLRAIFARPGVDARPAIVNGAAGVVVSASGQPIVVMGFTFGGGKIVEIDAMGDPERLPGIV